jgi:ribosome maturation factor RimP
LLTKGNFFLESWLEKLEKIAQEITEQEGCVLYDLEHVGSGQGRILRVYIDKENGVGIEDCSNVSKALNLRLDDEDIVPGSMYNLEVSTPGLDRNLKKKWHYEKAIGKKVYIKLAKSLGSIGAVSAEQKGLFAMKQFDDTLKAIDDEFAYFDIKNIDVKIPLSQIEKAKLVFELKTNTKKK